MLIENEAFNKTFYKWTLNKDNFVKTLGTFLNSKIRDKISDFRSIVHLRKALQQSTSFLIVRIWLEDLVSQQSLQFGEIC